MTRSFDPDAAMIRGGLFGLPHSPDEAEAVVVPVPWEATVSHGTGTSRGPEAILAASSQLDLLDRETGLTTEPMYAHVRPQETDGEAPGVTTRG